MIRKRVNVLKALAGTTWGQQKETLVITCKSICRSTLEYGALIWTPVISNTNWKHLQVIQNEALCIATGCPTWPALTTSTKRQKCCHSARIVICWQSNICSDVMCRVTQATNISTDLSPRLMKNDLDTQLQLQFQSGELANYAKKCSIIKDYRSCFRALHTICMAQTVADYEYNKVLNTTAPEIDSSEIELPRNPRNRNQNLIGGQTTVQNWMGMNAWTAMVQCNLPLN